VRLSVLNDDRRICRNSGGGRSLGRWCAPQTGRRTGKAAGSARGRGPSCAVSSGCPPSRRPAACACPRPPAAAAAAASGPTAATRQTACTVHVHCVHALQCFQQHAVVVSCASRRSRTHHQKISGCFRLRCWNARYKPVFANLLPCGSMPALPASSSPAGECMGAVCSAGAAARLLLLRGGIAGLAARLTTRQ